MNAKYYINIEIIFGIIDLFNFYLVIKYNIIILRKDIRTFLLIQKDICTTIHIQCMLNASESRN